MFKLQGKTCTQKSSIQVTIKKKPVHISLYLNRPTTFSPEPVQYLKARSDSFNPVSIPSSNTSPWKKPVLLASHHLSLTPTPCKSPNPKYTYLNYEFDPPVINSRKVAGHLSIDHTQESRSTSIKQRKGISAGNNARSVKKHQRTVPKMTMRDLQVNLPTIIKSKRFKRKIKYRPSITDSF